MKQELEQAIAAVVTELFTLDTDVNLSRPAEQFGDYTTNVALRLAKPLGRTPRDIAEQLAAALRDRRTDMVGEVSVAGPGFLNLRLNDAQLLVSRPVGLTAQKLTGQEILVEFGDPNPFKVMHLGHLYTAVAGDAIAYLLEADGATVRRVSYHGDVGMNVAKAIWAIQQHVQADPATSLDQLFTDDTSMGRYYAEGATAFAEDGSAAETIRQINAHVYARDDPEINQIYDAGCSLSFKLFDAMYDKLGIHYVKRYLESESTVRGVALVSEYSGTVFEKSEGAVVYRGEKAGLHTRVFINSRGLPTYEAKDLGLTELKHEDYPQAARSIIVTGNEQTEYFKVMLAALAEINPAVAARTEHIAHGHLGLTTGKMSSRSGQVFMASDLLAMIRQRITEQYPESTTEVRNAVYLAAVKYTFLKNRIGGDIVFDVEKSVALEGNSGPYLQYAHARARSIINKTAVASTELPDKLEAAERSFARQLSEYEEVLERAVNERMPHHICTYLYELAQAFNRFYEHNRVIGDPREAIRLSLVKRHADTLRHGLRLLGIDAPERM